MHCQSNLDIITCHCHACNLGWYGMHAHQTALAILHRKVPFQVKSSVSTCTWASSKIQFSESSKNQLIQARKTSTFSNSTTLVFFFLWIGKFRCLLNKIGESTKVIVTPLQIFVWVQKSPTITKKVLKNGSNQFQIGLKGLLLWTPLWSRSVDRGSPRF